MENLCHAVGPGAGPGTPNHPLSDQMEREITQQEEQARAMMLGVVRSLEILAETRARHKLSNHRALGVAREVKDLIKVMSPR